MDQRADSFARATIAKSVRTYVSEIRCWIAFIELLELDCFLSPPVDVILKYISVFRNTASAQQYLKALRWFCVYTRYPTPWANDPSVLQTLRGAKKLTQMRTRAKPILSWAQIEALVSRAKLEKEFQVGTVIVLATSFMFRVPSECIPLCSRGAHSSVEAIWDGGRPALLVSLASRKNLPQGAQMIRRCVCLHSRRVLCPVCELRDHLHRTKKRGDGRIFDLSTAAFTKVLRRLIQAGGSVFNGIKASECSSHIFRRSSAMELMRRRTPLGQIMRAGQWGGGGFLSYLLQTEVDSEAIFDCMIDGSDSDGEQPRKAARKPAAKTAIQPSRERLSDPFALLEAPQVNPGLGRVCAASPIPEIAEPDYTSIFGRARRLPGSPCRGTPAAQPTHSPAKKSPKITEYFQRPPQ